MSSPTVALAVSGHGYGHAVRSAQVAQTLVALGARVVVRTDAPRWLFPKEVEHIPSPGWPLDVGVVQHDGLDINIDETRQRWLDFAQHFETRARVEARLLLDHGADVVVADVPPLAFAAAQQAGLPSLAVANFGWDWIYAAWPAFEIAIACTQSAYACADVLCRLPLHSPSSCAFPAFKMIEDVPLIARPAHRARSDVRASLGIVPEARLVLLSFGGFSAPGLTLDDLGRWSTYTFVVTPPLVSGDGGPANVIALAEAPSDYVSLVAACDAVLTKPGYGIAADCLAHRVPMLFTDRGPFREYDVLAAALPELGRARYINRRDVLAGYLGPHLDALLGSSATWLDMPLDGAVVIAQRALALAAKAVHTR